MKYLWIICSGAFLMCHAMDVPQRPKVVVSVVNILCTLYDEAGVKTICNEERQAKLNASDTSTNTSKLYTSALSHLDTHILDYFTTCIIRGDTRYIFSTPPKKVHAANIIITGNTTYVFGTPEEVHAGDIIKKRVAFLQLHNDIPLLLKTPQEIYMLPIGIGDVPDNFTNEFFARIEKQYDIDFCCCTKYVELRPREDTLILGEVLKKYFKSRVEEDILNPEVADSLVSETYCLIQTSEK